MDREPFSEQIGPIRVGLSGLLLVAMGAMCWFLVDPIDLPATLIRYVSMAGMVLGVLSVATWLITALWRREQSVR